MAKKIFRSIILVSFAVLLTSIVLIMGVMYGYFTRISEGQLKTELEIASQGVASGGTDYLAQISEQGRFTWIAADGTVMFDSAGATENHADREEVVEALRSGEGSSYRYSSTLTEKTVYCAKRLSDGTVLRISSSYVTAFSLAMGIVQPIAVTVIVAVILSALLSSRIAKKIVEPLKKLDLENPLENDSYEELAPVLGRLRVQQRQINAYIAELKQKKEEFDRISDSMSEGLVLVGKNDKIISINKAARRIFGCSGDPTGENFMTVEHSAEMNHAVETALSGKHSEFKKQIGGLEYQFDLSAIETDGETLGVVILAFDITDREFAERNRREFTANVSHELKTPLQSIIGSAELLENGMVKAEDMSRFVSHIRTDAQRLLNLINDIIRLSQLDENAPAAAESFRLCDIAREVCESLAPAAEAKNISLSSSGGEVQLESVRRYVYEIVYNLADNAIKYGREGGFVRIDMTSDENSAVITVLDNGEGIAPEDQTRIFERFYRVDKSHSRASGGTGLGLSIVKHSVQYLGGTVAVKSVKGEGSEFTVTLPIK